MATAHHWMEISVSGQSAKKTRTGTRAQPAPAIRVATSQSMTQQASWSRTRGTMPHTQSSGVWLAWNHANRKPPGNRWPEYPWVRNSHDRGRSTERASMR